MIAALFVAENGPYVGLDGVDPWPESRDARKYAGPHPVVAHPPCQRWGRYWGGGPQLVGTPKMKRLGDDDGCFESALKSVRRYGGVLEHPQASHAWRWFGLAIPDIAGGWTQPDFWAGSSCCVAQGHYGHAAEKLTWLYAVGQSELPELHWGRCPGKTRLDDGFHSTEERRRAIRMGVVSRLSRLERILTPKPFQDVLIKIAEAAHV